jgi:PKD repeat protein
VPGQEAPPQDMTGNGLYEDIDGDGDFALEDIQILFENRNTTSVQKNAEFYNFSGNNSEEVTLEDVRALYQILQNQ